MRQNEAMPLDKIAALRSTALFGSLDKNELSFLASRAKEQVLPQGTVLFFAHEQAKGLYVVVQGSVKAFRTYPDGREQVIHVEGNGGTLAELAVFDEGTYPATAVTEQDSVLLFLRSKDVLQLCEEHPRLTLKMLKVMAGRLRRHAEMVELLSLRDVSQRVARLLLMEARAHGIQSGNGWELTAAPSHQQLASRIGSVREVITRSMALLRRRGLITQRRGQLTIPDSKALELYALYGALREKAGRTLHTGRRNPVA